MFDKKILGATLSKSNIPFVIGKLLKHNYLKYLAFLLWNYELKVMKKRKVESSIFSKSLGEKGIKLSWRTMLCMDKCCPNQTFFIPLKISWNINIKNDLAFSIWSCEWKVMANGRVQGQIFNASFPRGN
jgi:hypothetical protein